MHQATKSSAALAAMAVILAVCAGSWAQTTVAPAPAAAAPATGVITSGWELLKEGQAEGSIEHPAKHATNPSGNLLRIAVTKYAAHPGEGRVGAKNRNTVAVQQGQWYDVTFNGISEGIGVGLVFSLESADGKVIARTTLPEIGRGGRGGGGGGGRGRGNRGGPATAAAGEAAVAPASAPQAGPPWRPYLVSLYVREASPTAHLTVAPIEPVPVWIDNLAVNLRR